MNSLLTASSILFPLITYPYVSRILGPEGTGVVSFASSIIAYFTIFAQLGIPIYGIRACARVRENAKQLSQVVAEIFTINLITCVLSYLTFFLALFFVPRMQEQKTLFIISSASVLLNTFGVEWLYKGLEQYTYIAIRAISFKLVAILAIFLLVRHPEDYLQYAALTVLALHGSYIINFLNLRKYLRHAHWDRLDLKRHLQPVMVFFAMSVSTTIYTHLDSAMLGFMKTDTDVGYYTTATNVKTLLVCFIASLGTVLMPRVSYYYEKGMIEEFYILAKKAINFVILLAAPLMVYFILFTKESILFLAGPKFTGSIIPMMIIMPTIIFIGLTNIMGFQILVPMGHEKAVMHSTILGAVIDTIINLLLIPRFGAAGAAFGTLVAEIAVFIFQIVSLDNRVLVIYREIHYLRILLSIAAGTLLSIRTKQFFFSSFIILLISACIFFGIYVLLLCLFKEPLITELLDQIFKKFFRRHQD